MTTHRPSEATENHGTGPGSSFSSQTKGLTASISSSSTVAVGGALHIVPSHGGHNVIMLFLGPRPPEGGYVHFQGLQLGTG